jgi:hypothetical protein
MALACINFVVSGVGSHASQIDSSGAHAWSSVLVSIGYVEMLHQPLEVTF